MNNKSTIRPGGQVENDKCQGDQPELYCPKCRRLLPLTEEYFWRNSQYESGLHECGCKDCENKSKRFRINPDGYVDYGQEVFDDFGRRAMADSIRRMLAPDISIDKAVGRI